MRRWLVFPFILCGVWNHGLAQWDLSLKKEAGLLVGGGVITVIGYSLSTRSPYEDPLEHSLPRLFSIDRWAVRSPERQWDRVSKGTFLLSCLGIPILALRDKPENRSVYLLMGFEAALWTTGLTTVIKREVGRPRPYVYCQDFQDTHSSSDYQAFVSGHTAMAFLGAVMTGKIYQTRYPDSKAIPWVWAGVLSLATLTGALRVASGQHFPTDVLGGAVLGSLVGLTIVELHQSPSNKPITLRIGIL